jgi:predicted transcriptional regulator
VTCDDRINLNEGERHDHRKSLQPRFVFACKQASIPEAARLMREYHVGNLVVIKEKTDKRVPVGIITDSDIVLEVIAEGMGMDDVSLNDIRSYCLTESA